MQNKEKKDVTKQSHVEGIADKSMRLRREVFEDHLKGWKPGTG